MSDPFASFEDGPDEGSTRDRPPPQIGVPAAVEVLPGPVPSGSSREVPVRFSPESAKLLSDAAIDPGQAAQLGVREVTSVGDLPEFARRYGDEILPALAFSWRDVRGQVVEQVRPARPVLNGDGQLSKYLWPAGTRPVINVLRPVPKPERVLIVEGTKQTLAALRYAPKKWLVLGIGGCSSWTVDGVANGDLAQLVDGLPITIIFDADLGKNLEVWTAASKLGEAITVFGASNVSWGLVPGRGETGLDDVLASLPDSRRARALKKIVSQAVTRLPAKPKASRKSERIDWIALRFGSRPVMNVDDDRLDVGTEVARLMKDRWDRSRLFMFGDVLTAVEHGRPVKVSQETFVHLTHQISKPMRESQFGGLVPAEYSPNTLRITSDICNRSFTHLTGVTTAPFAREDGTVCTAEGYDAASELLLVPTPGLEAVTVPDNPASQDVADAVQLLSQEWLGDFPFHTAADKANALALVLTPFVRDRVGIVPLAVLDGLGAGVGKGLFAEILSILVTGERSEPVSVPTGREEAWKTLHSYAAQGSELLMLDEAHILEGPALAQALTAPVITSRTLGKSEVAGYPNRMTWLAAGNHVTVRGDLFRRVYRIHLAPDVGGWENRRGSDFRHPNLLSWTRENRARLMSAALTLVRYWYVQGEPDAEQTVGFGSFEDWQRIIAGILECAGVSGFLDNLLSWREESAVDRRGWGGHLIEMWEHTNGTPFRTDDVRLLAVGEKITDPLADAEDTPDPAKDRRKFNYTLGTQYRKWRDVPVGGFVLRQDEAKAHNNVACWRIQRLDGGDGGSGGTDQTSSPCVDEPEEVFTLTQGDGQDHSPIPPAPPSTFSVDFETCSASEMATGNHEGPFLRVMAFDRQTTTDPEVMRNELLDADRIVTSGGYRFDLPAAAIHLGLDAYELTLKADDTEVMENLARPPRAVNGKSRDRYGLNDLSQLHLGENKDDALQRLKKNHGGYDMIPVDDPEYIAYALRDADLTRRVADAIVVPNLAYLRRERRVGALAGSLTARGVRVDIGLLTATLEARNDRTRDQMQELTRFGFPLGTTPASAPWRRKEAGPVFDALLGSPWPRARNGTPLTGREVLTSAVNQGGGLAEVAEILLGITSGGSSFAYQMQASLSPAGRIHPQHRITSATGRWSTSDPNLLGVGKRGEHLLAERDLILAEPGEVFISVDLAGIDARAVAGLSGDLAYIELMQPGVDIHMEIAETFFGERTTVARKQIKPYTHGIPYGRSASTLAQDIVTQPGQFHGKAPEEVEPVMIEYLRRYYARFTLIQDWQEKTRALCLGGGTVDNGFGRGIRTQAGWEHTQAPARQAQSCARDLAMEGLFHLHDAGYWPMVRMFIHDEVVLSVPEHRADEIGNEVAALMSFDWEAPSGFVIPILAKYDGLSGPRWSDAYRD